MSSDILEHPQNTLNEFYDHIYDRRKDKHDSPEISRVRMQRKLIHEIETSRFGTKILNIGSGPQALEKQLMNAYPIQYQVETNDKEKDVVMKKPKYTLFSVDIADFKTTLTRGKAPHVRGDATRLPFASESIDIACSNLAIDFLPDTAMLEALRVLKPSGIAFFHFHHPDMIPEDLNNVINPLVRKFWGYLKETKKLYESPKQILEHLISLGFMLEPEDIYLANDRIDKWWEVRAAKPGSIPIPEDTLIDDLK